MEDLRKVNSMQLYQMWKNLSIGLLALIGVVTLTRMLPYYLAPAIALVAAATLYTILYYNRLEKISSCCVTLYCIFYCLLSYSFVSILINVLFAWGLFLPPDELIFFNKPYITTLLLSPCCAVTMILLYFKRGSLQVCVDCRLHNGDRYERGLLGEILHHESRLQLRNLIAVFTLITVVVWVYFLLIYVKIDLNSRDWYVYAWFFVMALILDEFYFIFRYYNLYLDLKETDELIDQDGLDNMETKTYLRFYVICDNHIFVDPRSIDPAATYREVIDTPFVTRRSVAGIRVDEVRRIVTRMTGVDDGELRFFFGRKNRDIHENSILRYFYFLDGKIEDYPELNVDGEWMDFEKFKRIYATSPGSMSHQALSDLTRLATIIQTEKVFDERGFRKNKIKSYVPGFTLKDVRRSNLDFQDDKWIRISMFNSDVRFYRFKRWWRNLNGKNGGSSSSSWAKKS